MDWKLIGVLSLLGLVMAIGTISMISPAVEPWFWLVVLVASAWVIGTRAGSAGHRFTTGLLVGLANCVWVTGAHVLYADSYLAHHAAEWARMQNMHLPFGMRTMMLITGPIIGVISGCLIGLVAMVIGKVTPGKAVGTAA